MAKLQCELKWNGTQVTRSYTVVATEPDDLIHYVSGDSQPFIIECPDERLARKLGLNGPPNTTPIPGRPDLYQIGPPAQPPFQGHAVATTGTSSGNAKTMMCGTRSATGQYEPWSSGFGVPDDGN